MKAVIAKRYGPPDVLTIVDVPKPVLKADAVLIKIKASAVNAADTRTRGLDVPLLLRPILRLVLGLTRPRKILGVVCSGVVEATGATVTRFKTGDAVYAATGFAFGGNAEYIALKETRAISLKPTKASFEEAAAIPFGGTTALYFLDKAGIRSAQGKKVLIYGGTGAVGSAAIQIAKHYGAVVTAVCGPDGVELVRSLRSDQVIVYTEEDFTQRNEKYDIIFETVGKASKKACRATLVPNGRFVTTASLDTASETKEQLEFLATLFDAGAFKAVIDRTYPLEEIAAAHRYVDQGTKKGNVVITVN